MSAMKALTVNEAIEQLTRIRDMGLGEAPIVKGNFGDAGSNVVTAHGLDRITVKFDDPEMKPTYPKNQTQTWVAEIVRGQGRPKGTTRAVWIY